MVNSYFILELVIGITGITLGILLFTSRLIVERVNSVYNRSVSIIGGAYLMLGIGTLVLLYLFPKYDNEAKNFFIQCMLPIEALLFSAAMFSPIMDRFRFRRFLVWQSAAWGAILLIVLVVRLFWTGVESSSNTLFCIELPPLSFLMAYTSYYFLKTYKIWRNEHQELAKRQHVLYISVWLLLNTLALAAIICAFFNNIRISHVVFVMVYAAVLYVTALLYYRFLLLSILPKKEDEQNKNMVMENDPEILQPEIPVKTVHEPDWEAIEEKIQVWKDAGGMFRCGVTILDLSKDIGVNRTYLSHYINNRYESNFNHWINCLRIEEAQKRILEHPEISLMELAEQVGYSDMAHFSKQFKQIVGIPPSAWKKNKT